MLEYIHSLAFFLLLPYTQFTLIEKKNTRCTHTLFLFVSCIFLYRKTKTHTYTKSKKETKKKFTIIIKRQLRAVVVVEKENNNNSKRKKKDKYTVHIGGECLSLLQK